MLRDAPFVDGEYYHVFNRGAHKLDIFVEEKDYARFLLLLHLANTSEGLEMKRVFSKYGGQPLSAIFEQEVCDKTLVDVVAYSLIPNHFHLVLRQKSPEGITPQRHLISRSCQESFNRQRGVLPIYICLCSFKSAGTHRI